MEYAGEGTVRDELDKAVREPSSLQSRAEVGELPAWRKFEILDQVAVAMSMVHDKGVKHQDIKPTNIFVTTGGLVKLGDFGLASGLSTTISDVYPSGESSERRGRTTAYAAPELLSGTAPAATAATDVFAYGVTAYEIVTGDVPWYDKLECNAMLRVVSGQV